MREPYLSIVTAFTIAVLILAPIILIRINKKRVKYGRAEIFIDNASIKTILGIGGWVFFPWHLVKHMIPDNAHCGFCGYVGPPAPSCPRCNKNYTGQLSVYKCNYCFSTFNYNAQYCPKCGKDDHGKHKGGVS